MGISEKPDSSFRFALGSFIEDYSNKIEIVQLDIETGTFTKKAMVDHPYPSTKIMWIPDRQGTLPDLFATTGDYLRVWAVTDTAKGPCEVNLRQFLNNNKNSEYCAPLTAFDWNDADPNIIGTASIDTTCTPHCSPTPPPFSQLTYLFRYNLGFEHGASKDSADCPRQGGVRHRLCLPQRLRLRRGGGLSQVSYTILIICNVL